MKEYWVLERRLSPHSQAVHNSMKPETKAETNLHVTWAHEKLTCMFATQDRYVEAEALYEQALTGSEKTSGPKHTSTVRSARRLTTLRMTST
jgi:hypothetical protein